MKKTLQTPREFDLEEFPTSKLIDIQIKGDNWDIPKSLGVSKLSTLNHPTSGSRHRCHSGRLLEARIWASFPKGSGDPLGLA